MKQFLASILITTLALCGCTAADRVVRLYDESDTISAPFSSVLVVGVHKNTNARRSFETSLARAISSTGSSARSSLEFLRPTDEIDRQAVLAAVESSGADAVLVTRLIEVDTRSETGRQRTTVEAQRRNSVPLADFFRYEYVEYQDPMAITTVSTVVLATDFYRVDGESLIWSVESTSIDKESIYEFVDSVSSALTDALLRDGLIRRQSSR